MRDLQAWLGGRDAVDLASNPAEAFRHLIFAPALGHELHADADAKERPALLAHAHIERVYHTAHRVEATAAVRERAHAREHHPVGARDRIRIAGHHDRLLVPAFAC